MELRQIRYFKAIARLEHFGQASQRLNIAQPALSRQMRLLEAELGTALFERLPRGVRLTAAGKVFLDRSADLLEQLDHAVRETRAVAEGRAGVLRLGVIEVAAWKGIVPDSIRRFRAEVPEALLVLTAMSRKEQIEAIVMRQIDAGLIYNVPAAVELTIRPLARHEVMLAVHADTPFARMERITLAELADAPMIGFRRQESPSYYDDLQAALHRAAVMPRITAETRCEADMLALVSAGAGVALVNSHQRFRPPEAVRFKRIVDLDVALTLNFVHLAADHNPIISRFADTLTSLQSDDAGQEPMSEP